MCEGWWCSLTSPDLCLAYTVPTGTLTCFSRPRGPHTKVCQKIHGYRTCYTKHNMSKNCARPARLTVAAQTGG